MGGPVEALNEKSRVFQRVLRGVRDRAWENAEDARWFPVFAAAVLDRIRGPFLSQHSPKQAVALLARAWEFFRVRPTRDVRVEASPGLDRGTVLLTNLDDQPFIVDTARLFLKRANADHLGGFNVVLRVTRDGAGRVSGLGVDGQSESLALLLTDEDALLGGPVPLEPLRQQLDLARVAVRDFGAMTRLVETWKGKAEALAEGATGTAAEGWRETGAFLSWMLRENFVFMGILAGNSRYGIETLDTAYAAHADDGVWPEPHAPGTVFVRKADLESPIHRAGRIDEIRVVLEGEAPLIVRGLFTFRAVSQPCRNVPILRGVLQREIARQQATPHSFRYKGIANVFDSLPTEYLFRAPADAVAQLIDVVLDSEAQQEAGAVLVRSGDATAFSLITLPRGQFTDSLKRDLEAEMARVLGGEVADQGLFVGRYDTVLVHHHLTGVAGLTDGLVGAWIARVKEIATPWESRLWQCLAERLGDEPADRLTERYARAFPEAYQRATRAEQAAVDIAHLDALGPHGLSAALEWAGDDVRLHVYQASDLNLSELLPVLDNLALTVIHGESTAVTRDDRTLHIDTFTLAVDGEARERLIAHGRLLEAAIPAVFDGRIENDPLNGLVVRSGLSWQLVDVLRGYTHYLRQLGFPIVTTRVRQMLLQHPITCRALVALFEAKFDPAIAAEARGGRVAAAEEQMTDLLRFIESHDEDMTVTSILNLIQATQRTNLWREDRDPAHGHAISFKFACASVRDMKPERPLYEIYVHSRDVEGVHLRFGRVARGGIRWSDRSDFRTEVLGLVTTQQVKNVVIVPEGSKGGFRLHHPSPDRGAVRAQADRLYEVFISGLLDLTDNVVDGAFVRPPNVVCHDPEDPYLVVAADKGTAHLSDTANRLSLARGFWLGDAFASGGSNGYDHKKVGITARGAWVLVKRHFAEMGRDPYAEPFTAIGIGDMSGDVFGNGLIESPQTRLLAAFNHIHIFLDPEPDAAASHAERVRLFKAERLGGWNHYDTSKISEGGGVFDRTSKTIPLSPQARVMLGIDAEQAEPELVVRQILKMDVDLMWSGGIGTYVKASFETHEQADDRTNDRARVNATDLRCRVIGEGANLSFTQAGRIEAALRGVRLNTDFIDNSAGVDLSDHEVNLKILLNGPVSRGELDTPSRNALLEALTDEVAGLVLADNDIQGRQISRDRLRSKADIFPFGRAIAFLERHFQRDRSTLHLPTDEALGKRAEAGLGLTRPELATLSAHVKRWVYAELLASGRAKELSGYREFLVPYFPKSIQRDHAADIVGHQLADEIAMTGATTRVVGDAGAAFVPLAVESTGRSVFEVVDAYLKAQRLARAAEVRATLEELRTSVRLEALQRAWVQVDAGCREVAMFWLSSGTRPPTLAEVDEMAAAMGDVYALQADEVTQRNRATLDAMRAEDIPERVATHALQAQYLNLGLMVWWHARKLGISFPEAVIRQLAAGRASRLQEILDQLGRRPTTGVWDPIANRVLISRFTDRLRQLVVRVGTQLPATSVDGLEPLLVAGPLSDVRAQVDRLMPPGAPIELPALIVLEERLDGALKRIG
jgi:glutamate dehydrogenase